MLLIWTELQQQTESSLRLTCFQVILFQLRREETHYNSCWVVPHLFHYLSYKGSLLCRFILPMWTWYSWLLFMVGVPGRGQIPPAVQLNCQDLVAHQWLPSQNYRWWYHDMLSCGVCHYFCSIFLIMVGNFPSDWRKLVHWRGRAIASWSQSRTYHEFWAACGAGIKF